MLFKRTVFSLFMGMGLLEISFLLSQKPYSLENHHFWLANGIYLLMFAIILATITHHSHPIFGLANQITLVRASLTAFLSGFIVTDHFSEKVAWFCVFLVGFNLILDGLDGFFARKLKTESVFGARFDMETDAFLIFVLCLILMIHYQLAVWILSIGLMRYGFISAGWLWNWLNKPLPSSFRRKVICVIQIVGLILALLPILTNTARMLLLGLTLLFLIYSFGVDIFWLYRQSKHFIQKP